MTGRADGLERGAAAVLAAAAVAAWAARGWDGGLVYRLWSDRDLVRASEAWSAFPTLGAELTGYDDARLPGGAWALMLAIPVLLSADPTAAWRWLHLLHGLAAVVLGRAVARAGGGPLGGAFAGAALVLQPLGWTNRDVLWNPAGLDLPVVVVTAAWLAVARPAAPPGAARAGPGETGSPRGASEVGAPAGATSWAAWCAMGVGLGVAAQVHLSALSWGVPAVLLLGRGGRRFAWAGLMATYAPYLVADGRAGWANTRALLRPSTALADGGLVEGAGALAGHVVGQARPFAEGLAWDAAAAAPWALAVVGAARAPRLAAAVVVGLGLTAAQLGPWLMERYVQAFLPPIAALAGLGLASLPRARVLVGLAACAPLTWLLATSSPRHPQRWPDLGVSLGRVARDGGWSLAEAAARTVLVRPQDTPSTWKPEHGVTWLSGGEAGVQAPPCVLLVAGGAADPPAPGAVARALGDRTDLVEGAPRWVGHHWAVPYAVEGWCPTSMVNRYVRLPAEDALYARWDALSCGDVERAGPTRWLAVVSADAGERCVPVGLVIDVLPEGDGLDVTVWSNQLRGHAYFGGWYTNAVADVALVTGAQTVSLGRLGWQAAAAPARAHVLGGPDVDVVLDVASPGDTRGRHRAVVRVGR